MDTYNDPNLDVGYFITLAIQSGFGSYATQEI